MAIIPDINAVRYAFWGDSAAELATLQAAKIAGITAATLLGSAPYAPALVLTPIASGNADSDALNAAIATWQATGRPIVLGAGTFLYREQIPYLTQGDVPGLCIDGLGPRLTIVQFDFADGTPLFKLDGVQDTAHQYHFQHNGHLRDFQIKPGPSVGSAVRNQGAAVSLTGQMHIDIDLDIQGIHGDGVISPLRTDIDPSSNADGYASIYIDLCESVIENCQGRGFAGDAGIGCSSVRYSRARIGKNRQGGVVIGGHNHDVGNTASIYSNGYDADVYSDLVIGGDGITCSASLDALGLAALPFAVGDVGKTVTPTSAGKIPAGTTIATAPTGSTFTLSAAGTPSSATTVAAGSNGAALPQATIVVASTANAAVNGGIVVITTGAGRQVVTYNGFDAGTNTLTGCSGGTGTLTTGLAVTFPDGVYVQRTGLAYPGVHVKKVNGNVTGLKIGTCELDGNKVANVKLEGCATGELYEPRLISHETTFNDGQLSPPIHVLYANSISGAKNTSIRISRPYHRSEDTGAGHTLTLYDLGNNANNTDIVIDGYNVPSTDNVPAAQITDIANKNNSSRVKAIKGSTMKSSNGEIPQCGYRWTAGRSDTGCATINANTAVTDASATTLDVGKSITNAGIPANATVSAVTTPATATAWAVNTAYVVGNLRRPTVANGHIYVCTVAGTSHATTEPTWPTDGTTVVDGTCTWKDLGTGAVITLSANATADASAQTVVVGGTISSSTNTVITFNSVDIDNDALYAAGVFTAPYRGMFEFSVMITPTAPAAGRRVRLYLNKASGGAYSIAKQRTYRAVGGGDETIVWTVTVFLSAGDTVTIGADNNGGTPHAVNLNTTETSLSVKGL